MLKSDWTLECPCTNERLDKNDIQEKIQEEIVESFLVKREEIGDFYYAKDGSIFKNLYFEPNEEYL